MEDSAGSTPPAFVTIVCMLFFVTAECQIGRFWWILWPSLLWKVYSQATSCQTRRISKRRRGGRPSSPVSNGNSLGTLSSPARTWRKSPTVHAKRWLQSLTGCLCKTHSESSSQDWQQTLSFLPTREREGQRQSPKALKLSGEPYIESCSTLPLERRVSGCYWRSISTCPYLIWLSKNYYSTIRYAFLAIPGPQWLEVQVPTWVRRVMEVLVRRSHGHFLGWQRWSNSR